MLSAAQTLIANRVCYTFATNWCVQKANVCILRTLDHVVICPAQVLHTIGCGHVVGA